MQISPRPHRLAAAQFLAFAALALSLASCETTRNLMPDQPPTVTLTSGPIDTATTPQAWNVRIEWTASDPDGHVDHFEYAVDPPSHKQATLAAAETAWVSTHEPGVTVHFTATHRDSAAVGALARTFHVFALRAIDDRGGVSPLVVRAFYATTVAPDVQITRPLPSLFFPPTVPLPFRVNWHGHDADGEGAGDPVGYRYRVVDMSDYANQAYLVDPDSLLREGESSSWAGWTSLPGESTSSVVTLPELPSRGNGLFALVAVDAAGATTPYMMLDRNGVYFQSTVPDGASGPRIHVFNSLVDFTYSSGGWSVDPLREIPLEVGSVVPFGLHWDAIASAGRTVVASRWMLDGNPFDLTPRSGPDDDTHWSDLGPPADQVALPPLSLGPHRLYIEERDDFDDKSLAIVRIGSIDATPTRDLLVVDDTRLEVDKFGAGGTPSNYTRPWPSRAELDTFLFARGGVPWRGTHNPPTGVTSSAGLLAGYSFDTLGTRLGGEDPSLAVTLGLLARYRHVIWLVDATAAVNGNGSDPTFPITTLRAMSRPGRATALDQYVQLGGQVWLAGGGAAYASLINFDSRANNAGQTTVFDVNRGELGPGRILYDAAHIRSEIGVTRSSLDFSRSPAAVGGWSGHGPDGTLGAPDYSHAPATMRRRDAGVDPIPPTRLPTQASLYYPTSFAAGFVMDLNAIIEDFDPDPNVVRSESALDTVYDATGIVLPLPVAPVMTYYHGRTNAPFVYTGFEPWDFTRADCQALFDFVLGDIWRLSKSPGSAAVRASASTPGPAPRFTRTSDVARRDAARQRR